MANAAAATMPVETGVETDTTSRIIRYYAAWAAACGAVPAPMLDMALVAAVQVRMLKRLAAHHNVSYDESSGKALLGAVLGSALPARLGFGGIGTLVKAMPGIGTIAGMAVMPGFNFGATWALGRVFANHFAGGGTLQNANPVAMRSAFQEQVKTAPSQ